MAFVSPLPVCSTTIQPSLTSFCRTVRYEPFKSKPSRLQQPVMTATSPVSPKTTTTTTFDWLNNWYPVAWTFDIRAGKPYPISLLKTKYDIHFDTKTSTYTAYTRDEKPVPTETKCGLIFIFPGTPSLSATISLPISPTLLQALSNNPNYIFHRCIRRRFPILHSTMLENVADPAHVQWAHHGSEGKRQRVRRDGLFKLWDEDGMVVGKITYGDMTRLRVEWAPPCGVWYDIAGVFFLATWVVPDGDECELFAFNAEAPKDWKRILWLKRPRWMQHLYSNIVLDQDAIILQWQEAQTKDEGLKRYVLASGSWDAFVVKVRKWSEMAGGEEARTSRLDRGLINDVAKWHVEGCTSCSGALRGLGASRIMAWMLSALGLAMMVGVGVMGIVIGAWYIAMGLGGALLVTVGLAIGAVCSRWIRMLGYSDVGYRMAHAD